MKNKGITLIALVITIIVLLILAGITINLTIGERGILTMAKEAGKNYQNAAEYEQEAIGDFFNEAQNIIVGGNGNTPIVPVEIETLKTKVQPGDYVEYNGGNGYNGLWRVLYNDETYGIQIISDEILGEMTIGSNNVNEAREDYNQGVEKLNTYCRKYVNDKYAISGRCVGSDPLNPDDNTTEHYMLSANYNGSKDSGCKVGISTWNTDDEAMRNAKSQGGGIQNKGGKYWYASRAVQDPNSGTDVIFLITYASYNMVVETMTDGEYLCRIYTVSASVVPNTARRKIYDDGSKTCYQSVSGAQDEWWRWKSSKSI